MSTRSYFLGLTRLAFLDAMALILMSLQFIVPPMIVVNIIVVPAIYALQVYYISIRAWLLSGFGLLLITSAGFGLDSGTWTAVFLLMGFIYGIGSKLHIPKVIRVLVAVAVFALFIIGIFELLRKFASISWDEIMQLAYAIPEFLRTPLLWSFIVGLLVWGLISCTAANGFFGRVIKQLEGDGQV
jgi:hypothetical protein